MTPSNIKLSETKPNHYSSVQTASFHHKPKKAGISLHHVSPISEFEQIPKRRQGADGRTRVWLRVWGQAHKAQRNHYWLTACLGFFSLFFYDQLKWLTDSHKFVLSLKKHITDFTPIPPRIITFSIYRWRGGNTMTHGVQVLFSFPKATVLDCCH